MHEGRDPVSYLHHVVPRWTKNRHYNSNYTNAAQTLIKRKEKSVKWLHILMVVIAIDGRFSIFG